VSGKPAPDATLLSWSWWWDGHRLRKRLRLKPYRLEDLLAEEEVSIPALLRVFIRTGTTTKVPRAPVVTWTIASNSILCLLAEALIFAAACLIGLMASSSLFLSIVHIHSRVRAILHQGGQGLARISSQ
jgi:hypothetical protein